MMPVEHDAVDKHQGTLEYAEESLVSEKGCQGHGIEGRIIEPVLGNTEVLDGAENSTDKDEHSTRIESEQDAAQRSIDGAVLRAAAMKVAGEYEKARDDNELQKERSFDERMACAPFTFAEILVGRVRGTPAVQCLDDGRDEAKGSEHASRMDWGMVRDVIQDSA